MKIRKLFELQSNRTSYTRAAIKSLQALAETTIISFGAWLGAKIGGRLKP